MERERSINRDSERIAPAKEAAVGGQTTTSVLAAAGATSTGAERASSAADGRPFGSMLGAQNGEVADRSSAPSPRALSHSRMPRAFGSQIGAEAERTVTFNIRLRKPMTEKEFLAESSRQIFGKVLSGLYWVDGPTQPRYAPGTYRVGVPEKLLRSIRGEANRERGIEIDENGGVSGADERAKEFGELESGAEKSDINREIDQRFWKRAGLPKGTKIRNNREGHQTLYNSIRDEVLYMREVLGNLPPHIRALIKPAQDGKKLSLEQIDQLFRIVKKLEKLTPAQIADYLSKSSRETSNLDAFEKSVDSFLAEMARRRADDQEREAVSTRLVGLEESYRLYRELVIAVGLSVVFPQIAAIQTAISGLLGRPDPLSQKAQTLTDSLQANGFESIGEFAAFVAKFEAGFRRRSAVLAGDILQRYQASLRRAQRRYRNQSVLEAVHRRLTGARPVHDAQKKHEDAAGRLDAKRKRLSGRHISVDPKTSAQLDHENKAKQAKQRLQTSLGAIDPIFSDEQLSADRRFDTSRLLSASPSQLGQLIQQHLTQRVADASRARALISADDQVIYKMDALRDHFRQGQSIAPETIFAMIIDDTETALAIRKVVTGVFLATVALALAVASFGTATPAIIAAAGSVALGAYSVYDEATEYKEGKTLSDVGIASEPSSVWLVVSIVGLGLDAAAAAKALSALSKATRTFNRTSDVGEFADAVRNLERGGAIDARTADAAIVAARNQASSKAAQNQLADVVRGRDSIPISDPDVYSAYMAMARARLAEDGPNIIAFIDDVKRARAAAGLKGLPPDELAKAKQAYREVLESTPTSARNPRQIVPERMPRRPRKPTSSKPSNGSKPGPGTKPGTTKEIGDKTEIAGKSGPPPAFEDLAITKLALRTENQIANTVEGTCATAAMKNVISARLMGRDAYVVAYQGQNALARVLGRLGAPGKRVLAKLEEAGYESIGAHAIAAIRADDGSWRYLSWGRVETDWEMSARVLFGDTAVLRPVRRLDEHITFMVENKWAYKQPSAEALATRVKWGWLIDIQLAIDSAIRRRLGGGGE